MKLCASLAALLLVAVHATKEVAKEAVNPVEKTLQLLTALQNKIVAEGEQSTKVYDEFAEWCEDRSRDTRNTIKTLQAEESDLNAAIDKASDEIESLGSRIEELSEAMTLDESDLKAATKIRNKEEADFIREQKDLMDTIDAVERAVTILEREAKGGSSFAQLDGATDLTRTLSALVQASALGSADSERLMALVQSSSNSNSNEGDSDSELSPPEPEAYSSHTGTVIETLQGLLDKAEAQLEDVRQSEATKKQNFEMLKEALEHKIETSTTDMANAKKELAESGEKKATSQGDLSVTHKDLSEEKTNLGELHHNCMSKAGDFEEEMRSRGEELAAIAKAKQVIVDMTAPATSATYGLSQTSLLQIEAEASSDNVPADLKAVRLIKHMARERGSTALAQLSLRLDAALRSQSAGAADPFAKVKGLITDMITTLQNEASAEAQHKMWCDKELADTEAKKTQKEDEVDKLTTKIDMLSAGSAKLAEEVAELHEEFLQLEKGQAKMNVIRQEEHALYLKTKPEIEDGIKGVRIALKTLREYYAKADGGVEHEADTGAGSSIIGLLQVVESDFSKRLSELVAEEEAAEKVFTEQTKENEITRATTQQDIKYKSKKLKADDKSATELAADRDGVKAELEAVSEYLSKIKDQCLAKADPYEDRKKRQEQEIAGLKEALQLLGGEPVLLQVSSHSLRDFHARSIREHRGQ